MNRGKPFVSRLLEEREIERRRDIHKAKRDVRLQGVQRGESGWARGSLAGPRRPRTCRGAWPGCCRAAKGTTRQPRGTARRPRAAAVVEAAEAASRSVPSKVRRQWWCRPSPPRPSSYRLPNAPPPPRALSWLPQHVRNLGIDNETPAMYPHVVTNAKRRMAQRGEHLPARACAPFPRPAGARPLFLGRACEAPAFRKLFSCARGGGADQEGATLASRCSIWSRSASSCVPTAPGRDESRKLARPPLFLKL